MERADDERWVKWKQAREAAGDRPRPTGGTPGVPNPAQRADGEVAPTTPDATSGDGDPRVLPDDASMGATEDQYPLPDEQGSGGPGSNNEHGNPDLLSDRDDMDDMEETCLTSLLR